MKNRLIPQVKEWFPNDEVFIYMQDGAPFLTTKRVRVSSPEKHQVLALAWKLLELEPYRKHPGARENGNCKRTITMKRRLIENPIIIIQEYMK